MTPIEFWDCFIAVQDAQHGGPAPEPMTVERGNKLEKEIRTRLAKKGVRF